MKRYVRRQARLKPRATVKRYIRPYMRLEERITSVDAIEFPNLERALRRRASGIENWWSSIRGYRGDIRIIHVTKSGMRTEMVLDYIFNKTTGVIEHLGVKGLRGWDPDTPNRVDFQSEYDYITGRVKPKKR